jgi:glycosyltransferase involved in cell wall biosynthesis
MRGGEGGIGVVMVTPNFYPYIGGAEKQALELSKRLLSTRARVWVLTRRVSGQSCEEMIEGVLVRRAFAAGRGLINAATFMASCLFHLMSKRSEYDVIHVHLAGSPAVAACLAGKLLMRKVIVKVGGGRGIGEIAMSRKTWTGRIKLSMFRLFRPQFVSVTEDLKEEMAQAGLTQKICVIPNGVDIERYRPGEKTQREAFRGRLGWPKGICFLYVGRLAAEKRLDMFLRAFSESAWEDSGSFCVFVGEGPEAEGLREAARISGIERRVYFYPPADDIERYYAAADVFVLPSVSEGLSNALLEAMSAGLAALASRVGGTREAVRDGETGMLFDLDDEASLRGFIRRYADSPETCEAHGRAARIAAVERYSLGRVAQRYLELYG